MLLVLVILCCEHSDLHFCKLGMGSLFVSREWILFLLHSHVGFVNYDADIDPDHPDYYLQKYLLKTTDNPSIYFIVNCIFNYLA